MGYVGIDLWVEHIQCYKAIEKEAKHEQKEVMYCTPRHDRQIYARGMRVLRVVNRGHDMRSNA